MGRIKQSIWTAVAALLFVAGLALLFAALYRGAAQSGVLLWGGLALTVATIGCWFASARAGPG